MIRLYGRDEIDWLGICEIFYSLLYFCLQGYYYGELLISTQIMYYIKDVIIVNKERSGFLISMSYLRV